MSEHISLFFSGIFTGVAMTAENPDVAFQGAVAGIILYLIAWGLHRGSNS